MKSHYAGLMILLGIGSLTFAMGEGPPHDPAKKPGEAERPSPAAARLQAESLHTAIHATLQIVHHRYYREDEGLPIPAAILKDVFGELEEERRVKLRWLVVEGRAMNSDHKPRGQFEEDAVKALKSGKKSFERVEGGTYRRAGAVTLSNLCLKCHVPDRTSTEDRTAGLIISIPVSEK